ncbi:MAG TPA: response regulator transcription factor [Chloroflexia bacterium]|nr:response regulator transcription factor [Chloroflexia bacterium]
MTSVAEVLVLDDVMATREGVVSIVNRVPNVRVTKMCESSSEALEAVMQHSFDLALVDLQSGEENGILLGRRLLEINPELKVIIYTREASVVIAAEVYRHEYLNPPVRRAGSPVMVPVPNTTGILAFPQVSIYLHGYTLLKNITPSSFEYNLELLNRHGSFIDPEILDLLIERLNRFKLTPRELQCSELISRGKSNREIAEELGITRQAVENLINSLYHKLSIEGEPKDPGRRVLLALSTHRWRGLDKNIS